MITIGIIGFGGIVKSPLHAGAILNCPDYKLKAAADIMPDDGSTYDFTKSPKEMIELF